MCYIRDASILISPHTEALLGSWYVSWWRSAIIVQNHQYPNITLHGQRQLMQQRRKITKRIQYREQPLTWRTQWHQSPIALTTGTTAE